MFIYVYLWIACVNCIEPVNNRREVAECCHVFPFSPIERWKQIFLEFVHSQWLNIAQKTNVQIRKQISNSLVGCSFIFSLTSIFSGIIWTKEGTKTLWFCVSHRHSIPLSVYTNSKAGPLALTKKAFAYMLLSTSMLLTNIKSFLGYSGVKVVPVSVLNKEFRWFLFGFNYDSLSYRLEGLLDLSCWDIKGPFV